MQVMYFTSFNFYDHRNRLVHAGPGQAVRQEEASVEASGGQVDQSGEERRADISDRDRRHEQHQGHPRES